LANGGTIEIPPPSLSLHHEVELAVVICKKARDVPQSKAMDYVGGETPMFNAFRFVFPLGLLNFSWSVNVGIL